MPVIVLLSDSHEQHEDLDMPSGDILLFAGGLSFFSRSTAAIESFNNWLGDLPYRRKIVTLGNHERIFASDPSLIPRLLSNATVLVNSSVKIDGLRIFGSPITTHPDTAFGIADPAERRALWAKIPEDTNILMVHGPPFGILDGAPGTGEHRGDPELLARIRELPDLRLVVFGHVHAAFGTMERDGVLFVNCSMLGESGSVGRQPVVLRMERR